MAYGTIKVDTITFTDGGIDKSVAISGLVQNPTFTGNVTVTGTVSGNTVQGQTISGVTVTGTTANFTSGNFTNISGGTHTITSGVFALGTAANPSISFTSDPNTGIYSPGADQVAISTNGTGRLFVDASGTVSITPSNALPLSIARSSDGELFRARRVGGTYNPGLTISASDTTNNEVVFNTAYSLGSAPQYVWQSGSNERMRLDSSGRLGLGTSSPSSLLDVEGIITAKSGTFDAGGFLNKYGGDTNSRSWWIKSDTHSYGDFAIRQSTTRTGSTYDTKLLIDASGRVGIGTTSPARALDVNGSIQLSSNNALYINGSNNYLYADTTATELASATSIKFVANSAERARIDSSGRLLVGTSSTTQPASLVVAAKDPGACIYANTGGGTSGGSASPSYGLFVEGQSWNNATVQYGVYAKQSQQLLSPTYGGYFETAGRYSTHYGIYAKAAHNDTGTTTYAYGLYATAQGSGAGPGGTYGAFVANTTTASGSKSYGLGVSTATGPTTVIPVDVVHNGSLIARITSNGGLSNYSANNVNLSDRNAKKDIEPALGTWDCLKEWEIVNFRYKDQPDDADLNMGVIAQQVAESCPEVITVFQEAKEATETEPAQEERLGVKDQQMMWMAIKALQEAQLRIESLEAEVTALKAQ